MEIFVPQILIPKFLEPNDLFPVKFGVWGEYEVIKKTFNILKGKFEETQRLFFKDNKNIITDLGLKYLAGNTLSMGGIVQYLQLGTGTTTPVSTDTSLAVYGTNVASPSSLSRQGAAPDFYRQIQWDIGLSSAIGTWTEVGCGWSNATSNNLFSRNLFKDSNGNPVSVQKTSSDTLTVIYRIHFIRTTDIPTEDVIAVTGGTGSITAQSLILNNALSSATSQNINYLPSVGYHHLGTNSNALVPTLIDVRTSLGAASLANIVAYVTGATYRDYVIEWPANLVGTIYEASTAFMDDSLASAVFRFVEGIPKDNTKKFRLNYRVNYGRAA